MVVLLGFAQKGKCFTSFLTFNCFLSMFPNLFVDQVVIFIFVLHLTVPMWSFVSSLFSITRSFDFFNFHYLLQHSSGLCMKESVITALYHDTVSLIVLNGFLHWNRLFVRRILHHTSNSFLKHTCLFELFYLSLHLRD